MASLDSLVLNGATLDVDPYLLGRAIAGWGSPEQADLLHGLSDGLRDFNQHEVNTHGSGNARAQVQYIIQELDGRADSLLELLVKTPDTTTTAEEAGK